ncbi:MAG TPA: adenylate/guanylate cyclase domain-containing protein [Kofleriaceae bacterium]|nr:adenylate/guanylate cyclase domain-containing protein [Kofleriaceae bacterium]
MARLVYITAQGWQAIELQPHQGVGRHPNNAVQLLDTIVSKEHCVIERRGPSMVLRDLGSMNGTYINGERVAGSRVLRHGDEIRLGNTALQFDDGATPFHFPPPPPSPGVIHHPFVANFDPATGAPLTGGTPQWMVKRRTAEAVEVPAHDHLVSVDNSKHSIGQQVAVQSKEFLPFEDAVRDTAALRLDYERLRITWELLREIGLERDFDTLLSKILVALFRFVAADRGVILIKEPDGTLTPRAHRRRDGATAPINISSTILAHVTKERAGVMTHDAGSDFGGKSMFINRITSAIVVPLLHDKEVIGALWLDSEKIASFKPKDLELLTAVGNQVAMLISNTMLGLKVQQEIMTRDRFSRLLSPNVAEQVISGKLDIKKGGIHVPMATVFNSDLRGFTRMSEAIPAEEMVELLNEYFELMVECIFKYEGTLDKFMGDGIMAFWGAPAFHADDAVRSVQCSLEQLAVLDELNVHRKSLGAVPLAAGIGIHSGPLISGYVGSSKSLSYTVIGDTVNTSARLCGIAAGGQILVSEETANQLGGRFPLQQLPDATLKGKEKPLKIFEVRRT